MCEYGKKLDTLYNGYITDKTGEPTKLYDHISDCEECAELREENS